MAKKKTTTIVSQGFNLNVRNSNTSFVFQLTVQGDDGNEYSLKITDPEVDAELIKSGMNVISARWPDFDWKFQVDAEGNITGFK